MLCSYDTWSKSLLNFCKERNGFLNIEKNPSIGLNTDFFTGVITFEIPFFGQRISLIQSAIGDDNKVSLSFIHFKYVIPNSRFTLSIFKRDIFDRILPSKRIITGEKNFDRKFSINSSDKRRALNLFSDSKVQSMFLSKSLFTFNILINNGVTEVHMKFLERKLYSSGELNKSLDAFLYIIGRL